MNIKGREGWLADLLAGACVSVWLSAAYMMSLDNWLASERVPTYFGEHFSKLFEMTRRDEYQQFQAVISNLDYEWYMRTV